MSNNSKIIRSNYKYYTINSNGIGSIFKYGINFYNKQQITYTSFLAIVPFFLSMEVEIDEESDNTTKRVYCCINKECSIYENEQSCVDAGGIPLDYVPDTFDFDLNDLEIPESPISPPDSHWIGKKIIPITLRNATTAIEKINATKGIVLTYGPNLEHILTVKPGIDPIEFGGWRQAANGYIYSDMATHKHYIPVVRRIPGIQVDDYGLLEVIIVDNKLSGECSLSNDEECFTIDPVPTTTTPSIQAYDIPN